MKEHPKILLKNTGYTDQVTLSSAEARGAYSVIKKALFSPRETIIDEVNKSQLRGRGGAAFLTGTKWGLLSKTQPAFLMANGDESEIGTFKDRYLMERDPHLIIEGIMLAAYALNVEWVCIFIRGEYVKAYLTMERALAECYEVGYLGDKIFATDKTLNIVIQRGAGAYICGEESAQLDAVEGKLPHPRIKPPFPANAGLYGHPTIINNVETLANLPWIVEHGGEAYAQIGVEGARGTKLISASGHINKPGVYEIELGYGLLDFIQNECQGIRAGHNLKGVLPGGSSVSILTSEEVEGVTLDYNSLKSAGSSLGCAGFMVFDETASMPQAALNLAQFYCHEPCGQCTPCREGGLWIKKILQRIVSGRGNSSDLKSILNISDEISKYSLCALGSSMVLPIKSIINKFQDEFTLLQRE